MGTTSAAAAATARRHGHTATAAAAASHRLVVRRTAHTTSSVCVLCACVCVCQQPAAPPPSSTARSSHILFQYAVRRLLNTAARRRRLRCNAVSPRAAVSPFLPDRSHFFSKFDIYFFFYLNSNCSLCVHEIIKTLTNYIYIFFITRPLCSSKPQFVRIFYFNCFFFFSKKYFFFVSVLCFVFCVFFLRFY